MDEPRRLGNRYELGVVLGRGGMAEVFMAKDIRLGRAVAVKTLRADMARDATLQARFRREAQSAASLNHPAIVAVYDTGESDVDDVELPYIVMEYVDGSTLRDMLHSGRKLLPERSMEITSGILEALGYSHRNGIVHRDIKPANIMLNRYGSVKVMDFGIARAMGDAGMTLTQTSAVVGTAQYLSPEQAKGERIDARSDLYSTGCLLYELLTGRPPFIGDSPVAVAYQHVKEAPHPPSHFDPEVPSFADAIVLKALGKHPDERYQSADEMRADLERALDGRPIDAELGQTRAEGGSRRVLAIGPAPDPDAAGRTSVDPVGAAPTANVAPIDRRPVVVYASVGVLIACLVALALIVYQVAHNHTQASGTLVPNIVNKSINDAQSMTQNENLTLTQGANCNSADTNSLIVPAGDILSQSPSANSKASPGMVISYCLSAGPAHVTMFPNVIVTPTSSAGSNQQNVYFHYDDIAKVLRSHGFTDLSPRNAESTYPSGVVIDVQNQAGQSLLGQSVAVNTPIYIVVSTGPGMAAVPAGLIGMPCGQAINEIQTSAGKFQTVQVGDGEVTSTTPSGNASVPIGSQVTVTCAPQTSTDGPSTAPPSTPPATPSQHPTSPPPTISLPFGVRDS